MEWRCKRMPHFMVQLLLLVLRCFGASVISSALWKGVFSLQWARTRYTRDRETMARERGMQLCSLLMQCHTGKMCTKCLRFCTYMYFVTGTAEGSWKTNYTPIREHIFRISFYNKLFIYASYWQHTYTHTHWCEGMHQTVTYPLSHYALYTIPLLVCIVQLL